MKSLLLLILVSFSLNVLAGPEPKVNPDNGPDDSYSDYDDSERGSGYGPDYEDSGASESPWGDVYGDRDSGSSMFRQKQPNEQEKRPQYGDNTPVKEKRRPQPGESDQIPKQQQAKSINFLQVLFGCEGIFTNYQAAGSV